MMMFLTKRPIFLGNGGCGRRLLPPLSYPTLTSHRYGLATATNVTVKTELVKKLRNLTGAPVMECKNALKDESVNGDVDLAIEWLRKRGVALAAKKQTRIAEEGLVGLLTKVNEFGENKIITAATMMEMRSETDFVARNESFRSLMHDMLVSAEKEEAQDVESLLGCSLNDSETVAQGIVRLTATVGEKLELKNLVRISTKDREASGSSMPINGDENSKKSSSFIGSYLHGKLSDHTGTRAAVVSLEVSPKKNSNFATIELDSQEAGSLQRLADDLAMQVVGAGALFIDSIQPDYIEKEKEIETESARKELLEKNPKKEVDEEVLKKRVAKKVDKKLSQLEKEIVLTKQTMISGEGTVSKALNEY